MQTRRKSIWLVFGSSHPPAAALRRRVESVLRVLISSVVEISDASAAVFSAIAAIAAISAFYVMPCGCGLQIASISVHVSEWSSHD